MLRRLPYKATFLVCRKQQHCENTLPKESQKQFNLYSQLYRETPPYNTTILARAKALSLR